MEYIKEYLLLLTVSNILFALIVAGAVKKPNWTRALLAAIFLWASYVNAHYAMTQPEIYLEYRRLAILPFYRQVIGGFFSRHIQVIVMSIAACQFMIFVGLILNGKWTKLACIAGAIFGLAIAPLGVGSAFPATVLMAVAFFILYGKYNHDYIWKWNQYKPATGLSEKNDL